MVKYAELYEFYVDLVAELGVAFQPISVTDRRPVAFEKCAADIITAMPAEASGHLGAVFPCVRDSSFDVLQKGQVTSLQFVLICGFSNEREGECNEFCTNLFRGQKPGHRRP